MDDLFDVIIVGAGSAGCALARRLTDDPAINVALVEAGGAADPPVHRRARPSTSSSGGREIDWDYESLPQTGTAGRRHRLPRGRVLGGTSAINGMVYLRGAREDFDGWDGPGVHGLGLGARARCLRAARAARCGRRCRTSATSCRRSSSTPRMEAGYPLNPFFDDGDLDGCGWNRLSIHDGQRHSSYRAFVEPVLGPAEPARHHRRHRPSG